MENTLIGIILGMLIGFMLGWRSYESLKNYKEEYIEFAKWLALNAQPLTPNIGREWKFNKIDLPYAKYTTEELYEIFLKETKL